LSAAEGKTKPSRDVPLHGVEKKADCGHSYCRGRECRLDAAEAVLDGLRRRLDSVTRR
jgi:hypothetical protein